LRAGHGRAAVREPAGAAELDRRSGLRVAARLRPRAGACAARPCACRSAGLGVAGRRHLPARRKDGERSGEATPRSRVHRGAGPRGGVDRKSTRLNSSHVSISYAVFCLKKKKTFTHTELLLLVAENRLPRTGRPLSLVRFPR